MKLPPAIAALVFVVIVTLVVPTARAQFAPLSSLPLPPERSSTDQSRIHPAVVRVVAPGDGSMSFGSGTLVYVGNDYGLVITNWHVINEATGPISVHFPDGFYSLATIRKVDRDWDLAILATAKPNAEPVPLADRAPSPGELLTIAGYGSGQYRAATGVCTQYVAPGVTFPFEMVEVAVSARQGDSGGPIFNSRGELAGVLFGEGNGRTEGSYCGRVRWFLASLVPDAAGNGQQLASLPLAPLGPVAPRPASMQRSTDPARTTSLAMGQGDAAEARAPAIPSNVNGARVVSAVRREPEAPAMPVASTHATLPNAQTHVIGWTDLAGETLGEQVKTVLAMVGVLAVVLHFLKWMSTEPAES